MIEILGWKFIALVLVVWLLAFGLVIYCNIKEDIERRKELYKNKPWRLW